MDKPRDYHTEWTERQISYNNTNIWNLKKGYKWTYLKNRSRITEVKNKFVITRGKGDREI